MKQTRVHGFIAGQKSINDTSTYAVRVKEDGHQHDGQKLPVWEVGPGVWSLHRGDNVSFVLGQNADGVDVAMDVMQEHYRTLNWFERFIFKHQRSRWVERGGTSVHSVLLVLSTGMFLWGYYSLPNNWLTGYGKFPLSQMGLVLIGGFSMLVMAYAFLVDMYMLTMQRLKELIDYSSRDQFLVVQKECLHYSVVALATAGVFYFGHGTLSGLSLKFGWLAATYNFVVDAMLLALPLFATFLALSTPFATRGKAMPLFEYELKK